MGADPRGRAAKLVLTGSHGADPLLLVVRRLGLGQDVDLSGWVSSAELAGLYDSASGYEFPTLFEGFGLPVLEAMARGCPVIASDIPVLREVGSEDAVYVDALEPSAIAIAVRRLLVDPDARAKLAAAGRNGAATFTWQRTAEATVAVYRRLASSR